MSTVALFPWLMLKNPVSAGNIHLVSYERGENPGGSGTELQAILDQLMEGYLEQPGLPVRYTTLLKLENGSLIRNLDASARDEIFVFRELLAVSGLARRRFFSPGLRYWNSDNFSLVIQSFSEPYKGVTIETRRRDGSAVNYVPKEHYQVIRPDHVPLYPIHLGIEVDDLLLQALAVAKDQDGRDSLFAAIISFNLANTDNSAISEHIEVVLTTGAFQQLLECGAAEDSLVRAFGGIFVPDENVSWESCRKLSDQATAKRFKKAQPVREVWLRDLCRLRGDLAHGAAVPRYPALWAPREHLLLSSFVFPLLLKLILARRGIYHLTEVDRNSINLFEALACENHFEGRRGSGDADEFPWNRIEKEGILKRIEKKVSAITGPRAPGLPQS